MQNIQLVLWTIALAFLSVSCGSKQDRSSGAVSANKSSRSQDAAKGFDALTHKPFQDPALTEELFDSLWKVWEPSERAAAEKLSTPERRKLVGDRYGFAEATYDNDGFPMGFTRGKGGTLVPNCLICHGGTVLGKSVPGSPSWNFDWASFYEDVATVTEAAAGGQPRTADDIITEGEDWSSLGRGTTNAFYFSARLVSIRDPDMNLLTAQVSFGDLKGADVDAPPWWNVRRKTRLYSDGFAPVSARALMQFALAPSNDRAAIESFEGDFENILEWIRSLTPPKYPGRVNELLAEKGRVTFNQRCSECHGTYGSDGKYPNKIVPLHIVKTDPTRVNGGLTPEFRKYYGRSWLAAYQPSSVIESPVGYVAPPLNGIWASAPYFHNGSVPTIRQVLHSSERPMVWRARGPDKYDHQRVGLVHDEFANLPTGAMSKLERRRYRDTSQKSLGNFGHTFGDALAESELEAVLEYLKTL